MAGTFRFATSDDVPRVADYLAGALRGDGGAARYRRYLEPRWPAARPELGVVIEDGGRVRGFLGAIYAARRLAGRRHETCNIHSVAVDDSHRGLTLRAFNLLLRDPAVTFTCCSPSASIAKILEFFRFAHRPGERVLVPATGLGSIRRARVLGSPAAIDAALDDDGRRIARDHRHYRCAQLIIARGDRRCHVVAVRRGRGMRSFAEILHASDRELLGDELAAIQLPLLRALGTVLIGVERRWLASRPRLSAVYARLRPTYARSPLLHIDEVDYLYSELVPMYG